MQADNENWKKHILQYIRFLIPYLPCIILCSIIAGICITLFFQQLNLALRGTFIAVPLLLGSFLLLTICKKDLTFNNTITIFSFNKKYLLILFVSLFSLTIFMLAVNLGGSWIYPTLVTLLYVVILIQLLSKDFSKNILLLEIMLTQADFIWCTLVKYDFYFGGTDIMPHQFMATITYLSSYIIPPSSSLFANYSYFPLFHIFLAECSHVIGIDIQTTIFSVTWPISVISIIFAYYIFRNMVNNEQIALMACLIYSMIAIDLTLSQYMIPRSLAFVGFLILLYIMTSINRHISMDNNLLISTIPFGILIIIIMLFTIFVHQVSIILIIVLLCILMACEWFVARQKYIKNSVLLILIILSIAYWVFVAFSFTKSLTILFFNADLIDNPVMISIADLSSSALFYINSIGTEILLFFVVIAIGYLLWRKKSDYLTVLALFTLITLVLYVPNPLTMIGQLTNLFGFNRFGLFLGPVMALIMAVGIYIVSQYLIKIKIPINITGILFILLIFIYASSATGLLKIDQPINREYFNSDEVKGLDFINGYVPYGSTIYTDYFSQRYLDKSYFNDSKVLGLPYFIADIISNLNALPSYNGYIVLPYKQFIGSGLYLGTINEVSSQSIFVYPTGENLIKMRVGLEPKNKLYSNNAIVIYS